MSLRFFLRLLCTSHLHLDCFLRCISLAHALFFLLNCLFAFPEFLVDCSEPRSLLSLRFISLFVATLA